MSLRSRLLLAIGYVLLVAIVAFEVPLAINTSNRIDSEIRAQASGQADLLAIAASEELGETGNPLGPLVRATAESVRGRVIVVDSRGRLVADSERETRGTDFSNRPEVERALDGERVQERRESSDLDMELLTTAAPMVRDGELVGAVRITQSTAAQERAVLDSVGGLALVGLVVLGIGLIAAVVVAGQLSRPLRGMTRSVERIAAGDLDERVDPGGSSEQVTLANSVNEMTTRLADALRSQRQFVADASHQLRTPITGLRLRLEEARAALGSGGPRAAGEADEEIEAATREVDRLSNVVTEMLTLSKIGERRGEPTAIELADLVADASERWRAEAQQAGIELFVAGSSPGAAVCPLEDAERALDVLIENAIRYSPGGTRVEIRAERSSIVIDDQGPGIPPAEAEAVFERFHRGSSGRAGPAGTGLGLAIARGLARSWGGDVSLAPAESGGTRATLSFSPVPSDSGEVVGTR